MKQKMEQGMALIVAVVIFFMPICSQVVQAKETDDKSEIISSNVSGGEMRNSVEVAGKDSDELLQGYLETKISNVQISDGTVCYGTTAGDNLRGISKVVYDKIRPQIEQVAAGNLTSTQMVVTLEELGLRNKMFTAADLGVESVVENGQISAEAMEVLNNRYNYDGGDVMNALVRDCPYEMYWFGNTISYTLLSPYFTKQNGEYCVYYYFDLSLDFLVSGDYGIDDYTIDVAKISKVNNAIENAKQIINYPQTQNYSDMQTLQYYHDRICELNEYNYDAASPSYSGGYGDPWQIIYVFDNDPNTNVVCEGYSKSFGYLCDMTSFHSEEIKVYIVSGMMHYGSGSGMHMWNVIHMDDGQNYMVDITNCDGMCENELFIVPCSSGNVEEGYRLSGSYWTYDYVYDNDTKTLFTENELTLSGEEYREPLTYEVLFSTDGGLVTILSKTVRNRSTYGELPVPTKAGYEFLGWYTQPEGGQQIQPDTVVNLIDNQVLYARWKRLIEIEGFVARLYSVCLNRTPSEEELDSWIEQIYTGEVSGSQAAYCFLFSDEFLNKNYCDTCYIKKLYTSIMGRQYDQPGLEVWCGRLKNGMTREGAFNGFIDCPEFDDICATYAIQKGNTRVPDMGVFSVGECPECGENDKVTGYVKRLYTVFLERSADSKEERNWVAQFKTGEMSGSQAAYCFAFSDEFLSKNYCDVCFVKRFYNAILGREYDQAGLDAWCHKLKNGTTREEVFNGFINSPEFSDLCNNYGINKGNTRIPNVGVVCVGSCPRCGSDDDVTQFVNRLYDMCLNRQADSDGLRNWVKTLKTRQKTGSQVANQFFFSDEFRGHNIDDKGYIQRLYRVMLGREADAQGLDDWIREINNGKTRESVYYGFANSSEFDDVCTRYGISK